MSRNDAPVPAGQPDLERMERFVHVREFDGKDLSYSKEFLERFELVQSAKNWSEPTSLFYFKMLCVRQANTWRKGLQAADRGSFAALRAAFVRDFINSEPKIVVENKLASRKWLSDTETIDMYHNALIELGSKCDRNGDALCSQFLVGLPDNVRTFCASSDSHTLTSYVTRAKLYVAMHEAEFKAGGGAVSSEPVAAFRERQGRSKSPSRQRHERSERCYECDGVGHQARECASRRNRKPAPPRGRSPSPGRNRSGSRERDKRQCYRCDEYGHVAKYCPTRPKKGGDSKSN